MGFQTAISEITLVLFTTLAPSGVVAYSIVSLLALFSRSDTHTFTQLNRFLILPFIVILVGLVASATHLGNPSNALYVFLGVSHSPLSQEVVSAVAFLAIAEFAWLYSFVQHPCVWLQKIFLVMGIVCGAVFLYCMAFAYSATTIVTWAMWEVPFNLCVNALVCGPVVALLTVTLADVNLANEKLCMTLIACSGVAVIVNIIGYLMQYYELGLISNAVIEATSLVPNYMFMLVVFICASIGANIAYLKACISHRSHMIFVGVGATAALFIGIFCMRFVFYQMHMTTGLGI